jgi:NAD(P)-dependent dehydrogenase (short-subunit alcohol dehydrogenase family)
MGEPLRIPAFGFACCQGENAHSPWSCNFLTRRSFMPSILITGSNRGLGLEWARQYAVAKWKVFATCRHPAEAYGLKKFSEKYPNLSILRLDITRAEDIQAVVWELHGEPIDILLNNAGIYLEKGRLEFGCFRYQEWLQTFDTNTLGAMRVSEAFVDNVAESKKRLIVIISSHMGSITDIQSPEAYYYRSSKAALNAASQALAHQLKPKNIGVLILHPGGVNTRMSSGITTEASVKGMRQIIDQFTLADTGRFIKYDGSELPW